MSGWPPHPDDEWIEVTSFGDAAPRFELGLSGTAQEIERAKDAYVAGRIQADELERRVHLALYRHRGMDAIRDVA